MTSPGQETGRGPVEQAAHLSLPWPQAQAITPQILELTTDLVRRAAGGAVDWRHQLDDVVGELYGLNWFDRVVVRQAAERARDPHDEYAPPDGDARSDYKETVRRVLAGPFGAVPHEVALNFDGSPHGVLTVSVGVGARNPAGLGARPPSYATGTTSCGAPGRRPRAATAVRPRPPTVVVLDDDLVRVVKPAEARLWTANDALRDARTVLAALMADDA